VSDTHLKIGELTYVYMLHCELWCHTCIHKGNVDARRTNL